MPSVPAHADSPRSFQLTFIDETHVVSAGFGAGSQRKLALFELEGNELKEMTTFALDVSPSILYPFYDEDTSILYVWGKGESPSTPSHPAAAFGSGLSR
jgi:hypothetical protein